MKKVVTVVLVLAGLAIFVYWILPAALQLLFWTAIVLGVGFVIYLSAGKVWREKQARLAVGSQAKQEKRAHKTAEKSLKEMERKLATPTANEQEKQPLHR